MNRISGDPGRAGLGAGIGTGTNADLGTGHGIRARFALQRGHFSLDAEFTAPGRGITGLFGPSGSGKTTLLRCIAGLLRAAPGSMHVNGSAWQDDTRGLFLPTHRRAVGYVFQEASLFPHLSVRGNILYGWRRVAPARRRIAFESAVELLGVTHLLERSPATLSGGERQRVAVARALVTSPELLLADEPLASLDEDRKGEILPYLDRLHDELDLPILYVSHALDEIARVAEHLLLIRAGRIVAAGRLGELLTRVELPLAHREDASAMLTTRVAAWDADFQLLELEFAGGRIALPHHPPEAGTAVQRPLPAGTPVRLRVYARDVSLTLARATGTSILNILPVIVRDVTEDAAGQVLVRVEAGGVPLLARITAKSARLLGLAPGMTCFAQIKSVALLR